MLTWRALVWTRFDVVVTSRMPLISCSTPSESGAQHWAGVDTNTAPSDRRASPASA
jgi:hypothetical protein